MGRENSKGYGYNNANMQSHDLHMLQHSMKFDGAHEKDFNAPSNYGDNFGHGNENGKAPNSYTIKERVPAKYQKLDPG